MAVTKIKAIRGTLSKAIAYILNPEKTDEKLLVSSYGCAAGINKPYLKYRLSEGGKSRNKLKSAAMTYNVYRYAGYGRIRSCIFFCSYAVHGIWKYCYCSLRSQ